MVEFVYDCGFNKRLICIGVFIIWEIGGFILFVIDKFISVWKIWWFGNSFVCDK